MLILVDQDDTLADFDTSFLEQWRARYPAAPFVLPEQRRNFYLRDDYAEQVREQVPGIYCAPGFFRIHRQWPVNLDAVAFGKHRILACEPAIDAHFRVGIDPVTMAQAGGRDGGCDRRAAGQGDRDEILHVGRCPHDRHLQYVADEAPLALRAVPPRGSNSRSGRPFALIASVFLRSTRLRAGRRRR